jgi:hypothetical protein
MLNASVRGHFPNGVGENGPGGSRRIFGTPVDGQDGFVDLAAHSYFAKRGLDLPAVRWQQDLVNIASKKSIRPVQMKHRVRHALRQRLPDALAGLIFRNAVG